MAKDRFKKAMETGDLVVASTVQTVAVQEPSRHAIDIIKESAGQYVLVVVEYNSSGGKVVSKYPLGDYKPTVLTRAKEMIHNKIMNEIDIESKFIKEKV